MQDVDDLYCTAVDRGLSRVRKVCTAVIPSILAEDATAATAATVEGCRTAAFFNRAFAWHSISRPPPPLGVLPTFFMYAAQASTKDMEEAVAGATDDGDDENNAVVTCTICLAAYEEEEVVSARAVSVVAVCSHETAQCSRGT